MYLLNNNIWATAVVIHFRVINYIHDISARRKLTLKSFAFNKIILVLLACLIHRNNQLTIE